MARAILKGGGKSRSEALPEQASYPLPNPRLRSGAVRDIARAGIRFSTW
jgi:hypothetical protein